MTDDVRFAARPAPDILRGAVRELWHLADPGRPHRGLPKPYVEIVVSLRGVHWWRAAPALPEHRYLTAWVTPVQAAARYARSVGRRELIGARLEPWAARAWLGLLPDGNGTPPPTLDSFLGQEARRLRALLRTAIDDDALFARFGDWLASQPALVEASRGPPRRPDGLRVANLAEAVSHSPRHFRRAFAGRAGIAPKRWLLLHRLDAVLRDRNLSDPVYSLARLAADHGFADQAHLTREIRRFTGATPAMFRGRHCGYPPHMLPSS